MARFGRTTLAVAVLKLKDRTNSSPGTIKTLCCHIGRPLSSKKIRKASPCIERAHPWNTRSTDLLLAIYITPASATLLFFRAYLQYKDLLNSPLGERIAVKIDRSKAHCRLSLPFRQHPVSGCASKYLFKAPYVTERIRKTRSRQMNIAYIRAK